MVSPGSACLSSSTPSNSSVRSSCLPSISKSRDVDTRTSPLLGFYISKSQMRKILKKYHQITLQPFVETICLSSKNFRRSQVQASSAPLEEEVSHHGTPCTSNDGDAWEEARKMLDASYNCTPPGADMVQVLHETARTFQVAIERHRSLKKGPWLTKAWLGIDHNAWIKSIAYQTAVHALLQAALNIGRRKEDSSCCTIEESLMCLCNPLEDSIRRHVSSRDSEAEEWLWYQQHPVAVMNLTNQLEKNPNFTAIMILDGHERSKLSKKELDVALLVLALNVCATVMKLGPGKLSCPAFSIKLTEETGHLMDVLLELLSIDQVYQFSLTFGLKHEFLTHFGPRAAALQKADFKPQKGERAFWVELIQKQLRAALAREGVSQKLSSSSNIEVLEQELAVFGFFTALGRRARSYMGAWNSELDNSILTLLRYLEGGCVLFYPQLATLTAYQLFVEVVTEELASIPFFEDASGYSVVNSKKEKGELGQILCQEEEGEAIAAVLNICLGWVEDLMAHSDWVQQGKAMGALKFLSSIQSRVCDCIAATSHIYRRNSSNRVVISRAAVEVEETLKRLLYRDFNDENGVGENNASYENQMQDREVVSEPVARSATNIVVNVNVPQLEEQLKAFDEDLQTVEEVLCKLEGLLMESELSRFENGRVRLTAININLQKIRRLKKEAQAIEASLKSKARVQESLSGQSQQRFDDSTETDEFNYSEDSNDILEANEDKLLSQKSKLTMVFNEAKQMAEDLAEKMSFLPAERREPSSTEVDDVFDRDAKAALDESAILIEVTQFKALRRELYQLDILIRACAGGTTIESEENSVTDIVQVDASLIEKGKLWSFLSKSTTKFKNASVDVVKGTQLLASDVVVAINLLRRSILGHELTERERKILRRTCTDLASVIPIGFLMLLPVTAVGHAAMLAAIQKYVPALIPSAYASERLDLLKQLEQLRKMDPECARNDIDTLHSSLDLEERKPWQ